MKKRELSEKIIEAFESTPKETVELLERFSIGEYWERAFYYKNLIDATIILRYIQRLKQEGLDIGRGNAEFGYKLPIPEKGASARYLQIFRRR